MDATNLRNLKALLFHALDYQVYEQAVADFHNSSAKMKVTSCPARTSKSYGAAKDALPDIFAPGIDLITTGDAESMLCWVVAPNYDLAKEFDYFWSDLVSRRQKVGFDYKLGKCTNSPKQGNMEIVIEWGKNKRGEDVESKVVTKSATNEKSLQSEQVDVAILSEAARLPEIVWSKYLRSRCGRSIWPTTPDIQASWIWRLIEQGKAEPSLGIESFQFTGKANPKYDWTNYWTEHAKAESLIYGLIETVPTASKAAPAYDNGHDCFDLLIECKAMKEDGFAEQMGGMWVFHRGRIVPLRERVSEAGAPAHVIEYDHDWLPYAFWTVACDYGYADSAVAGFWATGPDGQVVLRRSVYEAGLNPDSFVEKIQSEWSWIRERFDISRKEAHRYVGDPKKPEVEDLMRGRGLPVWNVDKKAQADRSAGHMELMSYLATDIRTGQPRMLVHQDNREIIKEWRELRRNEKVRTEDSPTAMIGADHGYDMARYFVMSKPETAKIVPVSATEFERARRLVLARQKKMGNLATVPRPMMAARRMSA